MPSILVFCRDYLIEDFTRATECLQNEYNVQYLTDGNYSGVRDTRKQFYHLMKSSEPALPILPTEEEEEIITRCRLLRSISRKRALKMLRAMLHVLNNELERSGALMVIGQMVDEYVTHSLSALARKKNILYLGACISFFSGRIQATKYSHGEPFAFRKVPEKEVLETLSLVSGREFRQNYNQRVSFGKIKHILLAIRYYVKRFSFPLISLSKSDPLGLHYQCLQYTAERKSFLDYYRSNLFDADWKSKISDIREIQKKPVIFMPLSYCPESTNDYWVKDTSAIHYEQMVFNICSVLSTQFIIAVKEHSHMVGIRSRKFYRELNNMPSIINIPPTVSSKLIFEFVDIALLGGGSIGVEAYLSNLPVATYCDTSYWHEATGAVLLNLDSLSQWCKNIHEAISKYTIATPPQHQHLIEYSLSSTLRIASKGKVWPIPIKDDMLEMVQAAFVTTSN